MSNNTIKLADGNYAQEILSYYLWGQATPPESNKIVDEKWIRNEKDITVHIDAKEYMYEIGNNIPLARQKIFQNFFNNAKADQANGTISLEDIKAIVGDSFNPNAKEIKLTHQQFADLTYEKGTKNYIDVTATNIDDKPHEFQLNSRQYYIDTDSADYWKRAFAFGSTKLALDRDSILYVYDAQTGKALRLENIALKPVDDNFDFDTKDIEANKINAILRQIMDPSGIGKTVNINFNNNGYFKLGDGIYAQADYINDKSINYGGDSMNYGKYYNGLKILGQSGIYNFRDDQDRIVMFGSNQSDKLTEYTTNYEYNHIDKPGEKFQLDKDIDVSSLKEWWKELGADVVINNEFTQYLENGIVYVGGNGNDTITGSEYADKLIGGDGNDTLNGGNKVTNIHHGQGVIEERIEGDDNQPDYMAGDAGFDTYIAGDGDTIFDSDGDGQVVVNMGDGDNLDFYAYALDSTMWYELDQNKQRTDSYASKKDADLIIYKHEENKLITIMKFFDVAKHQDSYYSSLNITLQTEIETDPEKINYSQFTQSGKFDKYNTFTLYDINAHATIYCGEKDDVVTASSSAGVKVYANKGNDKVFVSPYTDIIYGGSGSDYIYGSSYNPNYQKDEKLKQLDKDVIIGEDGRDFIFGVDGDDEIHTGYKNEHTIKEGNNEAGDCAVGGEGNDFVFGSKNRDFLQGSEGSDIVYGGASDDIIIGDSFIRFGLKSKLLYNTEVIE
ncbi:MAG: hypothetical protein IK065_06510, partial [Neisseriaceae bacterium]|nr:hypothetical protein [Neisseriaceae bacterium]